MKLCASAVVAIVAAGSISPVMFGAIAYTAQTRTVTTGGDAPVLTASAPDFNPWDHTVDSFNQSVAAGGKARQVSSLNPTGTSLQVFLSAYDGLQTTTGAASSFFDVSFSLDEAADYTIAGNKSNGTSANHDTTMVLTVTLSRVDIPQTIYSYTYSSGTSIMPLPAGAGTLAAGTYRTVVNFSWTSKIIGVQATTNASMSYTLTIPGPGSGGAACALVAMGGLRRRRATCTRLRLRASRR